MILVTRRRKSSLVSPVPVFLEDISLPPKYEIENLIGLVTIKNCNSRDVWCRIVEHIE